MSNYVENRCQNLFVNEAAKRTLREQEYILGSSNEMVRNSAPSIIVVSPEGCGVSSYGQVYADIVHDSQIIRENEYFIDLVFPNDNEKAELLLYGSPKRVANSINFRNDFSGTMLISFKEFQGFDLIDSESFKRFIQFVEHNKTIHFMFHLLPEFKAKAEFISRLSKVINIIEVQLVDPSNEEAYAYFESEVKSVGYAISDEAAAIIKGDLIPHVLSSKLGNGYRGISWISKKAIFEIAIHGEEKILDEENAKRLIKDLQSKIELNEINRVQIGFIK